MDKDYVVDKDYVQDALDTLVVQGVGGAAMAQVFATLAVVELLSGIEARLNEIEKRIDQRIDQLVNEIAAIPSGR